MTSDVVAFIDDTPRGCNLDIVSEKFGRRNVKDVNF
jgi:hypothetical protein